MRWHIPKDEFDSGQLISAFLDMWIKFPMNKDLITHFHRVDVNFDMVLHTLFNSLLQSVLTLE